MFTTLHLGSIKNNNKNKQVKLLFVDSKIMFRLVNNTCKSFMKLIPWFAYDIYVSATVSVTSQTYGNILSRNLLRYAACGLVYGNSRIWFNSPISNHCNTANQVISNGDVCLG